MTMKRWTVSLYALAVLGLAAFTLPTTDDALEIGSPAPMADIAMLNVDGDSLSLADAAGENGLLVMFSCNTCPWVAAWEDRYPVVAEKAAELGIGMIVLNSNATYRDRGDGYADMQARAEDMGYGFPYVVDEDASLATAFGATRTPEVFLFNSDMKLAYHGAIDDNAKKPDDVENHYLLNAMTATVAGETIAQPVTKSVGCTIKFP
jgi:peroxiredoxin